MKASWEEQVEVIQAFIYKRAIEVKFRLSRYLFNFELCRYRVKPMPAFYAEGDDGYVTLCYPTKAEAVRAINMKSGIPPAGARVYKRELVAEYK